MRKWKRIVSLGMCAFLFCSFGTTQAHANSAQMRWDGMDATGAMVTEENCPVIVEKEVLTFDIPEFPKEYYREAEEYLAYDARVTAEYTFYNPADYTVTATLLFPFGNEPDYAFYDYTVSEGEKTGHDTGKFDILVNGQPIEKNIRHSLSYRYSQFVLERDMALLHDAFMTDDFYSPDMPVTVYSYKISDVDKQTYRAASVAFDVQKGDMTRKWYLVNQSGFHTQKDGDGRISTWVEDGPDGGKMVLYIIGEPLTTQPEWKFYKDGGVEDGEEIAGSVVCDSAGTETMTLKEFALLNYSESTGVSESDWYNAVIHEMKEDETHNSYGMLSLERYRQGLSKNLMRWYEYEISLTPGERITNTVTAPMYPGISLDFEPPVYHYTYLLSPAKTWAAFLELQIVINTPYYVVNGNIEDLKQTGTGYMAFYDGLPEEECEFTLSSELDPKSNLTGYGSGMSGKAIRIGILVCCLALCVVGTATNLMRRGRKAE